MFNKNGRCIPEYGPQELILVSARGGIEACYGFNDIWPGDMVWVVKEVYDTGNELREAVKQFWNKRGKLHDRRSDQAHG